MNQKIKKVINLLSETNSLLAELIIEVTDDPNEDDLIKIKILSQAVISIGSVEKLLVLWP